ncbi:hypothetical protein [uncultured Desulfobacter sp.]|uniref:hypothetical protein n=1 Tax=uncultured Desulfobacter sp. TaxID=240139 RepID=UPI002AAB79F6|nr:hypothetical protein [uncultured Desulfobacter sp.]
MRLFEIENTAIALERESRQGNISAALVNELKKALKTFLGTVKSLGEPERTDETGNIDQHAANQYMDKIKALINSSDFVEKNLVFGLERALGGRVDRIVLNKLKNSLQDFDYQGADEALGEVRFRMDIQLAEKKGV